EDESRIELTYKSTKEHVAEIWRTKFSIGGELNPLTEDLHQAVKNPSAELYAKYVHCFMELIHDGCQQVRCALADKSPTGKHTVFERVCRGMEIVKRLGSVQTDNTDRSVAF
ncbi:DNA binding, ATP binding protein, partial [Tanacetum coccineum]